MPNQLNILGPPDASSAATTGAGAAGGEAPLGWLAAGAGYPRMPPQAGRAAGTGGGLAGLAPLRSPPARAACCYATRGGGAVAVRKTVPARG